MKSPTPTPIFVHIHTSTLLSLPPQAGLAKACPGIISSRFIGNVFDDELGQPGTFYYVKWAQ